jgi:uncharacterized repeat protein (TIGR03803 family)
MSSSRFSYAFIISAVAALLVGCNGSQSPIGAPGTMPQASAPGARANRTNYKVLYSFGAAPDGQEPRASLIDVGGTLYGTTFGGGSGGSSHFCSGCGTVFSITPGGTEKVLHSFGEAPDGNTPRAGLVDVGGILYGTTSGGGLPYGACGGTSRTSGPIPCGTVFSVTPSGKEKVLHRFSWYPDGATPLASLIDVRGTLYGTTAEGGASSGCRSFGCGTVFSVTPSGTEKVLHSFAYYYSGGDGANPFASLIDVRGMLYGTTSFGGTYGGGTVFSITPSGTENVLYSFGAKGDGWSPLASLIDVDGTLYGTAQVGGAFNGRDCNPSPGCGTVFSITPSGNEKVLHSFGNGTDGANPGASLIDVKGTLYGTTWGGGAAHKKCEFGCGTVFSITPSGKEKVLHSFGSGTDGVHPGASLIEVRGKLYGTTSFGGTDGYGTVFALTP